MSEKCHRMWLILLWRDSFQMLVQKFPDTKYIVFVMDASLLLHLVQHPKPLKTFVHVKPTQFTSCPVTQIDSSGVCRKICDDNWRFHLARLTHYNRVSTGHFTKQRSLNQLMELDPSEYLNSDNPPLIYDYPLNLQRVTLYLAMACPKLLKHA